MYFYDLPQDKQQEILKNCIFRVKISWLKIYIKNGVIYDGKKNIVSDISFVKNVNCWGFVQLYLMNMEFFRKYNGILYYHDGKISFVGDVGDVVLKGGYEIVDMQNFVLENDITKYHEWKRKYDNVIIQHESGGKIKCYELFKNNTYCVNERYAMLLKSVLDCLMDLSEIDTNELRKLASDIISQNKLKYVDLDNINLCRTIFSTSDKTNEDVLYVMLYDILSGKINTQNVLLSDNDRKNLNYLANKYKSKILNAE